MKETESQREKIVYYCDVCGKPQNETEARECAMCCRSLPLKDQSAWNDVPMDWPSLRGGGA